MVNSLPSWNVINFARDRTSQRHEQIIAAMAITKEKDKTENLANVDGHNALPKSLAQNTIKSHEPRTSEIG